MAAINYGRRLLARSLETQSVPVSAVPWRSRVVAAGVLCLLGAGAAVALGRGRPRAVGFDFQSRVGLAFADARGQVCLAIPYPGLKMGAEVVLIDSSANGISLTAHVYEAVREKCVAGAPGLGDQFYRLTTRSSLARLGIYFALVNPQVWVQRRGQDLVIDLDQDGTPEEFDVCTSSEGAHYSIWSGRPHVGARWWHRYHYLGQRTEPTCEASSSPS